MKPFLLAVCLLVVAAPVADAATLRGRTSQDRAVYLRTDDKGRPTEGGIRWRSRCGDGSRYAESTGFRRPFDFRSRTRLRDEGDYSYRTRDGYRIRAHAWIRGRRTGPRAWSGRFGLSLVVRRDGRFVARCKTGIVTWRVSR
jgi:hypothetical protein